MVLQDLEYIFVTLDIECKGYIEWIELHEFDEDIYDKALDIDQLEAAIETVCGASSNGRCSKEYFCDVAIELERRHVMEEKIKWDFRALDVENVGRISLETALFLFKATHNDRFTSKYWQTFIEKRIHPESDVCLEEVQFYLCNIPEFEFTDSDDEYVKIEELTKSRYNTKIYDEFKHFKELQETDSYIATQEKERVTQANKLKNNADNLLNRMDEIGLQALLEEDFGDGKSYEGRPKEKVTATELLDALREKYAVLRDELLLQMLRNHIGEGMWQALPDHEKQEKLFQLNMKEGNLRKEGKLEMMAIHLPGSRISAKYNIFSLMGESITELEQRILDQQEKIRESGLPMEEVVREFGKKLNDKEKLNSSAERLLLDLNNRYLFEKEILTKKLQGLGGFHTLAACDREKYLFAFIQARLRAMQEKSFDSCAICIGLSERVQPRNHDRSAKDPEMHQKLSLHRLNAFKARRTLDKPILSPRLFILKSKLGRIDLVLQFLQELEHCLSLEREVFLSMMNSKEVLHHRISARKLTKAECEQQLSVLYAQWQGWRNKPTTEKKSLQMQNRSCLEEAVALRFESIKEDLINDHDAGASLLTALQMKQDAKCQKYLNIDTIDKESLEMVWKEQVMAIDEEWNDNIAAIIFGIVEISDDDEELLNALKNKYDILKDKLLMQSLMDEYGKAEWDKLSEKERQRHLMELRLEERKLRREGKYDELAKLLGDAAQSSELVNKMLGENRENYRNQLNERLRNRQRRIDAGEDPDTFEDEEDPLVEKPEKSSGNILKDLDQRFEDERDALLKKLKENDDKQNQERERQAEIMRLRLEARKAGREENFDSAALVLGLAERNQAALEDRLKSDRERQEELAKKRLEARRKRREEGSSSLPEEEDVDRIEPKKEDSSGWRDLTLKELARKHEAEYNILSDMLQDPQSEDLKQEARQLSGDDQQRRLNKLREKRNMIDFGSKTDEEEHMSIMEMAAAFKYVISDENLKASGDSEVTPDKVIISIMANLQEIQDEETRGAMNAVTDMSLDELVNFRNKHLLAQKEAHLENVCEVLFKYEGAAVKDDVIVKALDKKYDALLDKLALEALEKQMSDAEWKHLSEKERQTMALKLKLEQKRLLKEGKLDEAARLLGEGFKTDANLKKLMGENKKKHDELLQKRLEMRKQKRLEAEAKGEPYDDTGDDLLEEEEPEDLEDMLEGQSVDGKSVLADLQARYDDEKEALLARLQGADNKFMNEKERQAELTRLKREQRKAQQEGKFDTAAMMLGVAERNKADVDAKFSSDRARYEALAKERLEKLRSKQAAKSTRSEGEEKHANAEEDKDEESLAEIVDEPDLHEALMKAIEKRHSIEQKELFEYLQNVDQGLCEQATLMTTDARNNKLSSLKASLKQTVEVTPVFSEMAAVKLVNRIQTLQLADKDKVISSDDGIVSIMADLQQKQDEEEEAMIKRLQSMSEEEIPGLQNEQLQYISSKEFPQLSIVLGSPEETKSADETALLGALETKYDALKDKLILEGLEKQMGEVLWANMNEKQRQQKLLQTKLQDRKLKKEGRLDEASRLMNELLQQDTNMQALIGSSKAEQEKRLKERLAKRKLLKASGMTDEEIETKEVEEDQKLEDELAKTTTGNVLLDLEKNFEAEKDALMNSIKDSDSKFGNERQRQLELVRLRREAKKIQAEEKFDAAALVMGMAKSQQAAVESKMNNDRARQQKLAKERLEARRNRRLSAQRREAQVEEVIVEADEEGTDPIALQGNLLNTIERKHVSERNYLLELTQEKADSESRKKANSLSTELRQKQLFVLNEQWKHLQDSSENSDQNSIFEEAMYLKLEEMISDLDMKEEDVYVEFLADLQDEQDFEAESTMKNLSEKNVDDLKNLINIHQTSLLSKSYDNIAKVLFNKKKKAFISSEESKVEDELTDALKDKYDALKEKVYAEALKGKFGEDNWTAMTEKEKQQHLADMKANQEFNISDSDDDLDAVTLQTMDVAGDKENNKASDILKDLEKQFESEKDALLLSLRNADTRDMNERERQLKLAMLKRDKMRIKREEKYDGAALLFNMAKQQEEKLETSYENERVRQEQLARERIANKRKKRKEMLEKKEMEAQNEIEKLREEAHENIKQDLITAEKIQRGGTVVLQESVLMEMVQKHSSEEDMLFDMIQSISPDVLIEASKLEPDELSNKLNLLSISRNKLKEQYKKSIDSQSSEMNEDEKKAFDEFLTKGCSVQLDAIKEGLVISLVMKSYDLGKSIGNGQLDEDVYVKLMADLQERQSVENNGLTKALSECDRKMIENLKEEERKSRRAGYLNNVASVIFGAKKKKKDIELEESESKEMQKEINQIEADATDQLVQLEKEMEEEKRRMLPTMSGDDVDKYMKELERQEKTRRQAIHDQNLRQREIAKQKLMEKQKKRDEKNSESEFANTMILNAHKQGEMMREKTMAVRGAQKDTLEERLRKRREDRKRKQDAIEENERLVEEDKLTEEVVEEDAVEKMQEKPAVGVAEQDVDATSQKEPEVKKKKKPMPPLPGGGLKREKTVVEKAAELPENKKAEMINMLMREQTSLAMKINTEQSRQEEQVRALREKRRKRMEARENEAAAVLGLGQRQKTMVAEKNKGERERQIGQIRERVNRIKLERNSAQLEKVKERAEAQGTSTEDVEEE